MMQRRRYKVAVLGATGAVGREMLRLLDERRFPASEVLALASPQSVGERVDYGRRQLVVQAAEPAILDGVEILLSAVPPELARRVIPEAVKRGATCIDSSGAFARDPQVPLVVADINPEALLQRARVIALPGAAATMLAMALAPLHAQARLRRVVVSTYHSVSEAGRRGIDELSQQTIALLNQVPYDVKTFPARVAFNTLPQIGPWGEDDQCAEELDITRDLRRVLGQQALPMSVTVAQVPVFAGHALAVHAEFESPLPPERARELLGAAPGVEVIDAPLEGRYPMPLDCAERDDVLVGRLRVDRSVPHGLVLWVVADNLRRGGALGAVQVASLLDTLWTAARA